VRTTSIASTICNTPAPACAPAARAARSIISTGSRKGGVAFFGWVIWPHPVITASFMAVQFFTDWSHILHSAAWVMEDFARSRLLRMASPLILL
jgi:hypothetical protein